MPARESAHAGSPQGAEPYSFIAEPHPAAFTGDAIDAGGFEDLDVVAGERPRAIDVPCMQWQRAANNPDVRARLHAPFRCEDPHGRVIDVREREPLDTTGQHGHFKRSAPTAGVRAGSRSKSERRLTGGASTIAARTRASIPPDVALGRPFPAAAAGAFGRTIDRSRGPSTSSGSIASRMRQGYGTIASAFAGRTHRPRRAGTDVRSARGDCSMSGAYSTPDGHAVTTRKASETRIECCT